MTETKARAIAIGIATGMVSAMAVLTLSQGKAEARPMSAAFPSAEVASIAKSAPGNETVARQKMLAVYHRDGLLTGLDYSLAAQVFAGSKDKNDLLIAHDFALTALAMGNGLAKPIVAQTEDRLYASIGLGERFGTLGGKDLPLTASNRRQFSLPMAN